MSIAACEAERLYRDDMETDTVIAKRLVDAYVRGRTAKPTDEQIETVAMMLNWWSLTDQACDNDDVDSILDLEECSPESAWESASPETRILVRLDATLLLNAARKTIMADDTDPNVCETWGRKPLTGGIGGRNDARRGLLQSSERCPAGGMPMLWRSGHILQRMLRREYVRGQRVSRDRRLLRPGL